MTKKKKSTKVQSVIGKLLDAFASEIDVGEFIRLFLEKLGGLEAFATLCANNVTDPDVPSTERTRSFAFVIDLMKFYATKHLKEGTMPEDLERDELRAAVRLLLRSHAGRDLVDILGGDHGGVGVVVEKEPAPGRQEEKAQANGSGDATAASTSDTQQSHPEQSTAPTVDAHVNGAGGSGERGT